MRYELSSYLILLLIFVETAKHFLRKFRKMLLRQEASMYEFTTFDAFTATIIQKCVSECS